ncbi:cell division protein YceG involved in septum cleavage [Catenulispora sp. GP43]|uniref:endolytic transglycosylase MltG n=1 Tax=Catenulispora sp. GP43 TaxID=3156263 RepID=UPI0035161133
MIDEEPGGLGGFEEEVSSMLHNRAARYPDHTDPVGITKRHLKAARQRRWTVLGASTALAVTGGAVFGLYPGNSPSQGVGVGVSAVKTPGAGHTTGTGDTSAIDYTAGNDCPSNEKVPVDVPHGATSQQIADALVNAGVVKSAQAYLDAVKQDQNWTDIPPGTYVICPRMSGSNAVAQLSRTSNLSNASQIVVTPNEYAKDVIASLIDKRKWRQADFDTAVADNTIGLPAWSVDSTTHKFTVEGMLEPGTYTIAASDTPQSILRQMVANRMDFLKSINFVMQAGFLDCGTAKCTPEQVLTVASIAQGELPNPILPDGAHVAEGVYSRLKADDYLGIDSTALYYIGHLPAGQLPTAKQVQDPNNPYSTYAPHHGLPPTPVAVTSDAMIEAALAPSHDGVYYWCSTHNGTEFFTKSQQAEHDKDCSTR